MDPGYFLCLVDVQCNAPILFSLIHQYIYHCMNNPTGTLQDDKTLTEADKTSNMYCLSKEEYSNLLQNAIASKYKKIDKHITTNINKAGVIHAREAKIINRIKINGTSSCFITLNDHKDNFLNCPTTRLLNPEKNEVGRISKHILQNINTTLSGKLKAS